MSYLSAVIPFFAEILYGCMLSPEMILRGQVWRLVTWIITPYGGGMDGGLFGFIWLIVMLALRYWFSTMAEDVLGFKYYLIYFITGIVLTDAFAFLALPLGWYSVPGLFSLYYLNITVFLIVAVSRPQQQAYFMFLLPMNMMMLGIIDIGFIIYDIARFMRVGMPQILLVTVPAVLTFALLMVFPDARKGDRIAKPKRQREFKKAVRMTPQGAVHKCKICGRTQESNPELEFRYCSKCMGNYEYCQEHLFTHTHVK